MVNYVKLGDIGEIFIGLTYKPENVSTEGMIVLRSSNIQDGELDFNDTVRVNCPVRENLLVKPNDILMCSRNGSAKLVGKCTMLPRMSEPMTFGAFMTIIRTPYNSYLRYFFDSSAFRNQIKGSATTTINQITRKMLDEIEVPVFDVESQIRITTQFEKLSKLIAMRKEQLAKLDELVKARFVEMFGDVVHNTKHWPVHRFSDITTSRLGKMLDSKCQTGENSYPYLANFNVQWFRFNLENLNRMDFTEKDRIEFELQDGDLLVCEGGEIGRCAVWHNEIQPCYFQKALHRVRCDKEQILPYYLAWWFKFNCEYNGFAEIEGAKATIAHLPGAKLKVLPVVVPPLELQEKFTFFVEQTEKTKLTLQESLGRLEEMKKALMQEYFG